VFPGQREIFARIFFWCLHRKTILLKFLTEHSVARVIDDCRCEGQELKWNSEKKLKITQWRNSTVTIVFLKGYGCNNAVVV